MDFDDSSVTSEGSEKSTRSTSFSSGSSSAVLRVEAQGTATRERLQNLVNGSPETMVRGSEDVFQSLQFDVDGGDDFRNLLVLKRMPARVVSEGIGEELHHQHFPTVSTGARPVARHGDAMVTNEGRLGGSTDKRNRERTNEGSSDGNDNNNANGIEGESNTQVTCNTLSIEDAKDWDAVLGSMALVDKTLLSRLYLGYSKQGDDGEYTYEMETMVKVISPFFTVLETLEDHQANEKCQMILATLQRLASQMCLMQQVLKEKGFVSQGKENRQGRQRCRNGGVTPDNGNNAEENSDSDDDDDNGGKEPRRVMCRGVHSVHVDSFCRLVGVVDVEDCAVSLSDVIAFSNRPFSQEEVVAVLKSVVWRVGELHKAGFVHGCLHGGNVLCSTDDGHTVLTGLCGIMSNPLLPTDPSYISPRRAVAMRPLVDLLWSYKEKVSDGNAFPWVSDLAFHRGLLEIYGCGGGAEMGACSRDDVYAIGILTLSCLLGVPPFHAVTLKEIVDILAAVHQRNYSEAAPSLTGSVFASTYAVERFRLAQYSEEFISVARDFVDMCLGAGTDEAAEVPNVAGDLLQHPFLSYPVGLCMSNNEDEVMTDDERIDEEAKVDRVLHFLMYPIFSLMECAKEDCGTTPFLPRFYRNSIFASRSDSLRYCPLYGDVVSASGCTAKRDKDDDEKVNSIAILWPYLDKKIPHWTDGCSSSKEVGWNSILYRLPNAAVSCFSQQEGGDSAALKVIVEAKGMQVDFEAHAIIYSGKFEECLVLCSDDMPGGYRGFIDTLILRDLEDCVVEVLLSFQHVVLLNIQRCELLLGPCYYCYCERITDSNPVAVASAHLIVNDIHRVDFFLGGCTTPSFYGTVPNWENVSIAPYIVGYAGMSADFAALSLPQEHASTMVFPVDNSELQSLPVRTLTLCNALRGGYDYPYSHALAAYGNRFAHEDDNTSDIFLYFSEVAGNSIYIARIQGGDSAGVVVAPPHESDAGNGLCVSTDTTHFSMQNVSQRKSVVGLDERTITGDNSFSHFPIVFIMDIVGECIIEDCSRCTVFIMGSTECVTVQRCSQMQLFFMAREGIFEDCSDVKVYTLVTELLFLDHCNNVELFPLEMRAPYVEETLDVIVAGCADEKLRELLENALHVKDLVSLNVLLRTQSDTNAIDLNDCLDVHISSAAVPFFSVDFYPGDAPLSTFFDEAHCEKQRVAVPLLQYICEGSCLWETTTADPVPPLTRLHDLVNVSILRIPETTNPRVALGEPSSLVDVVMERIVVGVVHIADAVGTLCIKKCTGPLEIAVCAATHVIMESCEHVTLHVACHTFTAKSCHGCHTALYVNTRPCYNGCTNMQSSTLSILSDGFDIFLERAGVQCDANSFDDPLLQTPDGDVHPGNALKDISSIESLADALAVLHRPITLVPPLTPICIWGKETSFLSCIEERLNREEETRVRLEKGVVDALLLLSRRLAEETSAAILETPMIEEEKASVGKKEGREEEIRENLQSVINTTSGEKGQSCSFSSTPSAPMKEKAKYVDPFSCCVDDDNDEGEEEEERGDEGRVGSMVSGMVKSPQSPEWSEASERAQSSRHWSGSSKRSSIIGGDGGGEKETRDEDGFGNSNSSRNTNDDPSSERKWGDEQDRKVAGMGQKYLTEVGCMSNLVSSFQDTMAESECGADEHRSTANLLTHRFSSEKSSVMDANEALSSVAREVSRAGSNKSVLSGSHLDGGQPPVESGDTEPLEHVTMHVDESFPNDLIIGVHPDEKETVISVMRKVAAKRDALLRVRCMSSSLDDLQSRVNAAIERLRHPSK